MKIDITPICEGKKRKYKLVIDDDEPQILEKFGLRVVIDDKITKMDYRGKT